MEAQRLVSENTIIDRVRKLGLNIISADEMFIPHKTNYVKK